MKDLLMIVDQYRRFTHSIETGQKHNPVYEAQTLSHLSTVFGTSVARYAIVNEYDIAGSDAYRDNQFQVIHMNGDRKERLQEFIAATTEEYQSNPPTNLVTITNDSDFVGMLDQFNCNTQAKIAVWLPGSEIVAPFNQVQYQSRLLSEVIGPPSRSKFDVRLDYENLHIGLCRQGWTPDAKELIHAIQNALGTSGKIAKIVAYADWGLLGRDGNRDWQRELVSIGVETRYLINEYGKNTADMKIADDIRDLVEQANSSHDSNAVIALGTMDRDFRTTIETAKSRGQKMILIGLQDGISHYLRQILNEDEIIHIDRYLRLSKKDACVSINERSPKNPGIETVVKIAVWLAQDGNDDWDSVPEHMMTKTLGHVGEDKLEAALQKGYLHRQNQNGQTVISFSKEHPVTLGIKRLVEWVPSRIRYCLGKRPFPHVYSDYLINGMQMDYKLRELNIGQTRREAMEWLKCLEDAGLIVSKHLKNLDGSGFSTQGWNLPA